MASNPFSSGFSSHRKNHKREGTGEHRNAKHGKQGKIRPGKVGCRCRVSESQRQPRSGPGGKEGLAPFQVPPVTSGDELLVETQEHFL